MPLTLTSKFTRWRNLLNRPINNSELNLLRFGCAAASLDSSDLHFSCSFLPLVPLLGRELPNIIISYISVFERDPYFSQFFLCRQYSPSMSTSQSSLSQDFDQKMPSFYFNYSGGSGYEPCPSEWVPKFCELLLFYLIGTALGFLEHSTKEV